MIPGDQHTPQHPLDAFDEHLDPNSPAEQKRRAEQQDPLASRVGDAADVKRALEIEAGLTASEVRFLEDMSRLIDGGRTMTPKQRAWLNMILIRFGK